MEIWKDIIGYEGLYMVSNTGKVKTLPRVWICGGNGQSTMSHPGKLLSQATNQKGYAMVNLTRNGKGKTMRVHRAVAMVFLPNPFKLPSVNHKDGNKKNNTVENLEWCTNKENSVHASKNGLLNGRKGESCHFSKLTEPEVVGIYESNKTLTELSKAYGVSKCAISDIKTNKKWKQTTKYLIPGNLKSV